MERVITVHIEKLSEGAYLATSSELQGLVAQGKTITETLEIARDVAVKLLEAQGQLHASAEYEQTKEAFDYPLIIAT